MDNSGMGKIGALFSGIQIEGVWPNLALLLSRAIAGLSMAIAHGWSKVPPAEGFINGVADMGFPLAALFAWAAGLSEFIGGLLIALGLLTRPAAIAMAITMFVAAFLAHAGDPFAKKEMALIYLAVSVLIAGLGGGRFSVDALLKRNS